MKKLIVLGVAFLLLLLSCSNEQTLQKYFVEKSKDANFVALDVSPTLLQINLNELSEEEKISFKKFKIVNILALPQKEINAEKFSKEKASIDLILQNEKYQNLMKAGTGKNSFSLNYIGDDENIDEIIVYGNSKEAGLMVVRILGKKMQTQDLMNFVSIFKHSKMDLDQFQNLKELL